MGDRYRGIIEKGIPIKGHTPRMEIRLGPSGEVAWAVMETRIMTGKSGHRVAWQVVVFQKVDGDWRVVLAFDAPRRDGR